MKYFLYGIGFTISAVLMLGTGLVVDNAANWDEAEATVIEIKRECAFTTTGRRSSPYEMKMGRCDDDPGFEALLNQGKKRHTRVDGVATVRVSYVAKDGERRTGVLTFKGHHAEFYDLRENAKMDIHVAKADPTKIKAG